MIRLILTPAKTPGKFIARMDDNDPRVPEEVCVSHQPMVDGARVLLKHGFDPETLATCRHEGKAFDSFVPRRLGDWAQDSYSEGDKRGLRLEKWRPRPDSALPMRGTIKE
jgi:hypothetical protein